MAACVHVFASQENEAKPARALPAGGVPRPTTSLTDLDRKLRLLTGGPVDKAVATIQAAQRADQKRLTDLLGKLHPVEEVSTTSLSIPARPEFEMLRHLRTVAEIQEHQSKSIDELVDATLAAEKVTTRRWRIATGLVGLTLLASISVPLVTR
jgi:hypothetical protein